MPKGYPGSGKAARKKYYKRGRKVAASPDLSEAPNVHVVPLTSITRMSDLIEYMRRGAFILVVGENK